MKYSILKITQCFNVGNSFHRMTPFTLRPSLSAIWLIAIASFSFVCGLAQAESIALPNGSFESPETPFADPRLDNWEKSPQPVWYQGGQDFPWEQLVGQFLNTAPGTSNYIDNVEGKQAAFLFALPEVAISQDYNTLSGTNTVPGHEFNVLFEPGKSYALTVAVLGGGGGMTNGATLELSLYYRDAASNRVTVAATTITHSTALFPTNSHLIDFQARTAVVQASDAWAGKNIGVRLASTGGFELQGGYWDVDNVRLQVNVSNEPTSQLASAISNGQFQLELQSAPGRFEVLASPTITAPLATWTSLGILTNVTGQAAFTDTNSIAGTRYYTVRPATP